MKHLRFLLLAVLLAIPGLARAQFVSGIQVFNCVTNAGTNIFLVAASATTNLPVAVARNIVIGANGFGVGINATAASTSLATNTLAFEYSYDGVTFVNDLPLFNVYLTNCTAIFVNHFTNFPNTTANLGNIRSIRLKYITNSAAALTSWTNIAVTIR